MLRIHKLISHFFIVKIILDFFSPLRELNLIVQLVILLPIVFHKSYLPFVLKRKFGFIIFYFLLYFLMSQNQESLKILLASIIFSICTFIGLRLKPKEISNLSRRVWKLSICSFFLSLLLSIALNKYSQREFYNFEHVNLLGTYVVFLSIFYFITLESNYGIYIHHKKKLYLQPINSVVIAASSLSTGAFVTQLISFIPLKYLKLKKLFYLFFSLFLIGIILFFLTFKFIPDLHVKLFGTFNYFMNEISFSEFYNESINQNLNLHDSKNAGSFTWRIYSYIFYLNQFFSQNFINILFGSGIASFKIFAEFAPHNDFIAIMLDFGIFGLILFILFLNRLFKSAIKYNVKPLNIFVLFLIFRFMFENVIYSSYVFSLLASIGGLLFGKLLKLKDESIVCN